MATLKQIKGSAIQFLDEDPVVYVGSWSSQNNLNTTRSQAAGFGTASNMGAAGGNTGSVVNNFELWNGTSWTETTEINTARRNARGVGAYTQGMIFGGYTATAGSANTETWNGSAWTEVNDMTRPGGQQSQASFGTYTDAIAAGGEPGTGSFQLVEKWDGTNWTEVNELNTGRQAAMGFGIITSGFVIGGYSPPSPPGNVVTNVESFNGTSFTETTDINTARGAGGATGNTTAGLIYGGQNPGSSARTETESWNGSAWTEVADLATGRTDGSWTPSPSSNNTSALFVSGAVPGSPGFASATEEWSFPPATASILQEGQMWFNSSSSTLKGYSGAGGIPSGTWASGGNMNTPRSNHFALGTQTANIVTSPQGVVTTESYNGSSWTALPSPANSGEGRAEGGSAGTQTAGVIFGGWEPGASALTETWNGSIWTEVSDLNTGRSEMAGLGTQTAAFSCGGGPNVAIVESWDGSSWTETTDLNTGRGNFGGAGTTTDGLVFGGTTSNNFTESWNGTSWTEVNNLNTGRNYGAVAGVSAPLTMYAGGNPATGITEAWNGTSWTEVADMANARYSTKGAPGSTGASMLVSGGTPGPNATLTEEYTSTAAVVTVTTS